ncbi:MAG: hypothetical protein IT381_14220 [Deltaproteobacteria bacterium]|nr:hypothetical protein [Deltaproteobacteria bacterium]
MPRPKRTEMPTTSSRFVRQYMFDEEVYKQFEAETERRGATPGGLFRKVMIDYLAGRYITLDDLKPEALAELTRFAETSFGTANLQVAVSAVLNKATLSDGKSRSR